MKKFFNLLMVLMLFGILFSGCSPDKSKATKKMISVNPSNLTNRLYYSGIVRPLKTLVIPSPADGVVIDMPFQYGEEVKAGQLLFKLASTKFLTEYKTSLMAYIKAKSEYNTNKSQLDEARFLHQNKLISDDEFKSKKANYYAAQLGLLQARDTLENLLFQLDVKNVNLYDLNITDIEKINQAMHMQITSDNLKIIAPAKGVILASNKNDDESKKTLKGDVIKQGDVLAVVGDMSGIRVRIKVNELVVNQLHAGQKVTINGIAFPDYQLHGVIQHVDRQGDTSNGGLPTFNVEVVVSKLSAEEQKQIHVGMSANVEIALAEEPKMIVPIIALHEKNGVSYLQRYDERTKKTFNVAVQTGKTTADSVVILSGINAGDKIVVPN